MYRIRVKHRGRDLAIHTTETLDDAHELMRVYVLLDYPEERIELEDLADTDLLAA